MYGRYNKCNIAVDLGVGVGVGVGCAWGGDSNADILVYANINAGANNGGEWAVRVHTRIWE